MCFEEIAYKTPQLQLVCYGVTDRRTHEEINKGDAFGHVEARRRDRRTDVLPLQPLYSSPPPDGSERRTRRIEAVQPFGSGSLANWKNNILY